MDTQELLNKINRLEQENKQLVDENFRFKEAIGIKKEAEDPIVFPSLTKICGQSAINKFSTVSEKINLFMLLFSGRTDVYAKRWYSPKSEKSGYSPACLNEWETGICDKKRYKCSTCPNRKLAGIDSRAIDKHLRSKDINGREVVGIYPMFVDETCKFLVVDFDDGAWQQDVTAFRQICIEKGIDVAIERSRSGNGAHAWFFFEEAISAVIGRKFGSILLTFAMNRRHEISFKSYDRLLPNQDTLPRGGFGNLIALPLQGGAREHGNSEFVDESFMSYVDQWAYLSCVEKLKLTDVERYISELSSGNELGVLAQDKTDEEIKPWERSKPEKELTTFDFPSGFSVVRANMIYIEKDGVSQRALNRIKRLAAFKNPEFYKAQAMRLSTYNKTRIICTIDETDKYLGIPRGCGEALIDLLNSLNVSFEIEDKTNAGRHIDVLFNGVLRDEQIPALKAMLINNTGVLAATTAFGKTVVGANLIAERKVNTLILVHTQTLLTQWKKALELFLLINETLPEQSLDKKSKKEQSIIGQLGAGKDNLSGIVDIAIMQSLVNDGEVKDIVKNYGMVIVDECHHVSALSFENILKEVNAKYVYGLTATPTRQDGHHPIIFMQCGPIRYKVDAKEQAEKRPFDHFVIPRFTGFKKPISQDEDNWAIAEIYNAISEDTLRNQLIIQDVITAVQNGRSPIVLTERSAHVKTLSNEISKQIKNVISLTGSASVKEKREIIQKLNDVPKDEPLVIVATGKYVGEGFDEPRLDTLFLAMPIAWKGTLAQYAGRLHRTYEGKNEVVIYDYIDVHIKTLEKMYHKRVKGYALIGYKAKTEIAKPEKVSIIYDSHGFMSVFAHDIIAAKKEIVIVSPFLRKSRIAQMLKIMSGAMINGVKISVVTRSAEDYGDSAKEEVNVMVENLKDADINVICKTNIHQNFAIIDQRLVWYGSVNLLSFGSAEESIMRLDSAEIASELLGTII